MRYTDSTQTQDQTYHPGAVRQQNSLTLTAQNYVIILMVLLRCQPDVKHPVLCVHLQKHHSSQVKRRVLSIHHMTHYLTLTPLIVQIHYKYTPNANFTPLCSIIPSKSLVMLPRLYCQFRFCLCLFSLSSFICLF